MDWVIPGTTLVSKTEDAALVEQQFVSMFLAGGVVLSQVTSITALEPYTVQNWVKRGFLTPPRQKRYNLNQLCRIISINMLKSALPLEQICGLLEYVNGDLSDDSDDLIDDAKLYFLFVRLAANFSGIHSPVQRDAYMEQMLADYHECVPGAKERIKKVVCIMLTAWGAAQMRQQAAHMIQALSE